MWALWERDLGNRNSTVDFTWFFLWDCVWKEKRYVFDMFFGTLTFIWKCWKSEWMQADFSRLHAKTQQLGRERGAFKFAKTFLVSSLSRLEYLTIVRALVWYWAPVWKSGFLGEKGREKERGRESGGKERGREGGERRGGEERVGSPLRNL